MVNTVKLSFEAAHRLLGHPGRCQYLHGHTYTVKVQIGGDLDPGTMMVFDFRDIKDATGELVDQWDHAILLERGDPLVEGLRNVDQTSPVGNRPLIDRLIVMDHRPTAEYMALVIFTHLVTVYPPLGKHLVGVQVQEGNGGIALCTPRDFALYAQSIQEENQT